MLATLRQRDFALLWFAGLISLAGDWMLRIALPLEVYRRTGSTMATAAMFMAGVLPHLLLGSVAGVFVDRWDRKRTMVVANLSRAVILLLLLFVRSGDWLWVIYVVAAAESAIGVFFAPAENALLPRLVGEDRLVAANSLNSLNNNLARLLGPPLGGAVAAFGGLTAVALVDSATYALGGGLIALIAAPSRPVDEEGPSRVVASRIGRVGREWLAGLRVVKSDRTVSVLFLVAGMMALGEGILGALYVPFVAKVLGGDELYLGWLAAVQAVGGIFGGVLVARFGARVSPRRLFGFSAVVFGLTDLAIFNSRSLETPAISAPVLALVLMCAVGVPATGVGAGYTTLLQTSTVDEYRGRVFGALAAVEALLLIAGLGLGGVLGEVVGIVPMLSLDSALYASAGLTILAVLPKAVVGYRSPALTGAAGTET